MLQDNYQQFSMVTFHIKYKYTLNISFKERQFVKDNKQKVRNLFKKQNLLSKWNGDWLVGQAPQTAFSASYSLTLLKKTMYPFL